MKHRDLDRKRREHKRKWRRLRAKRDNTEITRQYTASELEAMSQSPGSGNGNGILRLGTGELTLPPGMEGFDESQPSKSPPRVMLVIVTLALLFIAVIAYFVSQMPQKE